MKSFVALLVCLVCGCGSSLPETLDAGAGVDSGAGAADACTSCPDADPQAPDAPVPDGALAPDAGAAVDAAIELPDAAPPPPFDWAGNYTIVFTPISGGTCTTMHPPWPYDRLDVFVPSLHPSGGNPAGAFFWWSVGTVSSAFATNAAEEPPPSTRLHLTSVLAGTNRYWNTPESQAWMEQTGVNAFGQDTFGGGPWVLYEDLPGADPLCTYWYSVTGARL